MLSVNVIARKRDGESLTREEIDSFVSGVTSGAWPDYQSAALLMAVVLRGMTPQETAWLTDALLRSGERVSLADIPGVKVGKHSTGGVGDKASIALAPIAAACGVVVPKMSGRGLGHTGGTLDKLEAIPGFRVDLTVDEFKRVLREVGTAIIGQSAALVPADKKLYALRDVTATVSSVPLIAASVMSKKLAEGSDAIVLDVKCGDGAFMKTAAEARELAAAMVSIGTQAGVRTEAFITAMDAPLGRAVGNALEIVECIEILNGGGSPDLVELVSALAARLVAVGRGLDDAAAADAVRAAIASGRALEKLQAMIAAQGGNPRVTEDYALLPQAARRETIAAERSGYVTRVAAEAIGYASMALGAGRTRVGDAIDYGAGIIVHRKPGEQVRAGEPILELLYNDGRELAHALTLARGAVTIGETAPAPRPIVLGRIT